MNTPKTMSDEKRPLTERALAVLEKHGGWEGWLKYDAHISARLEAAERLAEILGECAEKLFGMEQEFSRPNFTDRYGDGPQMGKLADAAKQAIHTYRSLT